MLSGYIAREQIQERVRTAAKDRQAAGVRRAGTRKVGSGLLAAFASLRPRSRSSRTPARVARTVV